MTARILIVDPDVDTISLLSEELASDGWRITWARDVATAYAALARASFDVALIEVSRPDLDGPGLMHECRRRQPGVRLVGMAGRAAIRVAAEALRHGAHDYVIKPFRAADVARIAHRAMASESGFGELIGSSKPMQTLVDQIRAVAGSNAAVLLSGPSGSGKELVARAIHRASRRADGPLVAVHCGSIPTSLLESEMFGHEPGAFTGADRHHEGLITAARGGTLLLDEVGATPPALQLRLLRVLQDHRVRPVGASEDRHVDFRVVAATSADLPNHVREGRFRDDLFYRLAVVPIRVPSLRERREDIPLLARYFLARAARELTKSFDGFEPEAADWLLAHSWPGNVRELENIVQRAAVLSPGPRVSFRELRVDVSRGETGEAAGPPTLAEIEKRYIRQVLALTHGDKRRAARILGISVRTLQRIQAETRLSTLDRAPGR